MFLLISDITFVSSHLETNETKARQYLREPLPCVPEQTIANKVDVIHNKQFFDIFQYIPLQYTERFESVRFVIMCVSMLYRRHYQPFKTHYRNQPLKMEFLVFYVVNPVSTVTQSD